MTVWPGGEPGDAGDAQDPVARGSRRVNRVVLPWMQQASSAAAWALVSGIGVRAGPEIQVPFHSDGLR